MIADLRERMNHHVARRSHAVASVRAEREALAAAEGRVADALAAQKLVQEAAEATQRVAHRRIASVVTRCLRAVFGPEAYEFRLAFEMNSLSNRGGVFSRIVRGIGSLLKSGFPCRLPPYFSGDHLREMIRCHFVSNLISALSGTPTEPSSGGETFRGTRVSTASATGAA